MQHMDRLHREATLVGHFVDAVLGIHPIVGFEDIATGSPFEIPNYALLQIVGK
jgi:hypothetical protein